MKIRLHHWLPVLFVSIIAGCYPKGAEYVEELDLVVTSFDEQYDFSSKLTYSIPDSVPKIDGDDFDDPDGDGKPDFVGSDYSDAILNAIKDNMAANGWTLVDKNANPDVTILPSTMTTTNIYYYYDWWYWGWYYPGWYPGWGWYYPGYYPPYVTGYRSGSVFIQMVDNESIPRDENAHVAWVCLLNGLAEGGTANITSRIQTNIAKGFAQSPYLKH